MKLRSSLLAILMPTLASADEVLLNWREDTGAWVGKRLTTVPGHYLSFDANGVPTILPYTGATGDVVGPASATSGVFPTFSGTTGKVIANSIYTPAYVLSRANHSGTQAVNTITGLAPVATSGSATDLSAGSLADARLSANIPRLASANTFTADTQTIATANNPALVVNSTGGSGTNKAAAFAAGSGAGIISFDNSGDFGIGSNTKANVTTTPGSGGETWRMWIKGATGNVGIGTTAPSTLLHIHKDQNTDTELRVQNSSDLSSATANINLVGSQGSTLVLQANPTTGAAPDTTRAVIKSTANVFGLNLKAESSAGTLQFYTGGGAAANERLRITAAGNVGIGTTAPLEKLHVLGGKVLFGDPTDSTGTAGNGDLTLRAWRAPQLNMVANNASSEPFGLNLKAGATTLAGINVNVANGEVKIGGFWNGGYFPTFYSNNVERMRIDTAGNVGIGTNAPTSNLTVAQSATGVGTISVGAAGTTVTGVNTQFLNTFKVGDTITSAGQTLTISAIASDTSMTTSAAGALISGQAYTLVGGTRFTVAGNGKVGIGSNVFLERDGADNTLALRNGAAAQTFRVYNTYSNAGVDVEYLQLSTSVNGFRVGTNSSGSGTPRPLFLGVGGGSQWQINTAGHIGTFGSDNLYDIGASGANRPRNVYVGTSITCAVSATVGGGGYLFHANQAAIGSSGNGKHILFDSGGTFYDRLQFGGTSASFPAIKRVGADFQVVVANTSAASNVAAADADMTFIEDRFRRKGTGTPEAAVTAPIGAVYHRTDGGAGTSFYVKESGTGNTGWVAK